MKHLLFIAIIMASLTGCNSTSKKPQMAVGSIEQEQLLHTYQPFNEYFDQFSLTSEQIAKVKAWPKDIRFDVYFGTWCPDSQREVPKLLKALTFNRQLTADLIALDMHKTDPNNLAKKAKIKFTATFIVLKQGKEIGRVVERPKDSLIDDIDVIIKNNSTSINAES